MAKKKASKAKPKTKSVKSIESYDSRKKRMRLESKLKALKDFKGDNPPLRLVKEAVVATYDLKILDAKAKGKTSEMAKLRIAKNKAINTAIVEYHELASPEEETKEAA